MRGRLTDLELNHSANVLLHSKNILNSIGSTVDDQNVKRYSPKLVLIEWLISITEQGRLSWKIEHGETTASVSLPPLVHLRFDWCVDAANKRQRWGAFSISGEHSELFRVESKHDFNGDTKLHDAADALFIAALKSTGSA